ncbi:MAG: hypothetical protein UX15_C0033G0010 [Parcubacteria group bacterium GW2011_GWA1_45_7]|nr:MAG: hypothetical protein UX15_C0033G0010 [Parcubacteria group bacterium GW2011_GWA1_45_7]
MAKRSKRNAVTATEKIHIKPHPHGGYGLYTNGKKHRWVNKDGFLCLAVNAQTYPTTKAAAGFAGRLGFSKERVLYPRES